ncbi:MAG TPA: bifunctional UDP-N-acetylglucosamine diphosphorylase/glucosamine-1-phosphate N-acetyltransferase GlmU [Mycobacteriales bacterium]|nr:bifunctional UDP-N-acetylglucosamine diphosphorylase/glucosamine-1-phosphate N-acetyltransferase GlmU [Mycobacteriales bacterium]
MTDSRPAAAIVLAAGQGTRMKSATAKVLHTMCGRTLLGHVLAAVEPLGAAQTLVVLGHGREQVTEELAKTSPGAKPVVQAQQNGTGHAARLALEAAGDVDGAVVVVPGDTPLLTPETLQLLLQRHIDAKAAATLLTARMPNPAGYGRIVRDGDGHVTAIVEERDADERVRQIDEVGTSIYVFDAAKLRQNLARITTDNAQGEEYLTDVIGLLVADGDVVASVVADDHRETLGINDRVQLATARRTMRDRIVEHWMRAGVTVTDPETTWMGVRVQLEPDVTIHQNTQLHGRTTIRSGAVVGPDCTLTDTEVGAGATVVKSHCTGAEIGPGADVGPFSYLRPGTKLGARAKAGAFVEMKEARVGDDSKVPHLSYVGDAEIGERSNIGAATVFVNYDGVDKHRTKVGDDARVGSDTMLVAPVEVGDGAYTAAGSVITDDVPPGAIGVARERQRNVEGWVERRRAGTKSAESARRAREQNGDESATMDSDGEGEQGAGE